MDPLMVVLYEPKPLTNASSQIGKNDWFKIIMEKNLNIDKQLKNGPFPKNKFTYIINKK
jgi:hypothetical protein